MHPLRRVGGRGLLVEGVAVDAVGHPLHRQRPAFEMGQQQVRDVVVVGEEVALGVALLGPERLVQVGDAELPLGQVHPPRVAVLAGREGSGELDREGGPPGAPLPRGHGAMVAISSRGRGAGWWRVVGHPADLNRHGEAVPLNRVGSVPRKAVDNVAPGLCFFSLFVMQPDGLFGEGLRASHPARCHRVGGDRGHAARPLAAGRAGAADGARQVLRPLPLLLHVRGEEGERAASSSFR